MNLMRKKIELQIEDAEKHGYAYTRIRKTGDKMVDEALMETIAEWGYKVAQNKGYIMVMTGVIQ